jgi:hypothetical protein
LLKLTSLILIADSFVIFVPFLNPRKKKMKYAIVMIHKMQNRCRRSGIGSNLHFKPNPVSALLNLYATASASYVGGGIYGLPQSECCPTEQPFLPGMSVPAPFTTPFPPFPPTTIFVEHVTY